MVSVAAIINVDDMNSAYSQSANAGDVKKINNRINAHILSEACSPSMPEYVERMKSVLFDSL